MICEGIVTYPMWIGVIYSYKTKNLNPIKWMIHALILRTQLGFLNMFMPPKEENDAQEGRMMNRFLG